MTTPAELMSIYSSQSQLSSFFTDKIGIYSIMSYANKKTIYDGITSATTALTNCITACAITGGIVMIPTTENGSTYLIDDDITFPSNVSLWSVPGALLKGSLGTETITINGGMDEDSFSQRFENILIDGSPKVTGLYPEWFGAESDATTDDTTAINTTVTACYATQMKLKFRPRVYKIDGTITITNFIEIEGQYSSNFRFDGMCGTMLYSKTASADAVLEFDFDSGDRKGFSLKNIVVCGNSGWNSSGSKTARRGISILNTSRKGIMENVTIQGFTLEGLYLDSVYDSDFRTVTITWCGTDNVNAAFHITSNTDVTNACRFFALHIEHCPYMFYIEKARQITFIGSKFEVGSTEGATTTPMRIADFTSLNTQEIAFTDCLFACTYSNNFWMLQIDNERTEIKGCWFAAGSTVLGEGALYINHTGDYINIHDNTFYYCNCGTTDVYPITLNSRAKFTNNKIWAYKRNDKMYLCKVGSSCLVKDNTVICSTSTAPATGGMLFHSTATSNVYRENEITGNYFVGGDYTVNINNVYEDFKSEILVGFTDDATPDVLGKDSILIGFTGATDVTDFDRGYLGQKITITSNDGNGTIKHLDTLIRLNGAADFTMASGDTLTLIKSAKTNNPWLEVSRSVN